MRILAPTRYPWTFNGPRNSRHEIERQPFIPLNKVSAAIEGITVFRPTPPRRFDLIHAFNRIPLGTTPFIIGFESHLPRGYGLENTAYYNWMLDMLASPRCRGIFPISDCAQHIFSHFLNGRPQAESLLKKTQLRHPNLVVDPSITPRALNCGLTITFVGAHFARKGGIVAVKLAELARQQAAPINIEIISKLEMGGGIWTDPTRAGFYEKYDKLIHAENVTLHGPLKNSKVQQILKRSHFSLLTTFADTFGYSAIESMALGTPVIGTRQGALPEFIFDEMNGILLPLDTNALGEWIYAAAPNRGKAAFEDIFDSETDRLAAATFERIMALLETANVYDAIQANAHQTALDMFGDRDATSFWDDIYDHAL